MAGDSRSTTTGTVTKSYFDVLGLCCSSEVPLIEKILHSLDGIVTVSVIVPSRTVVVVHDSTVLSQLQIVKALNQARLEAAVRPRGKTRGRVRQWPSPYTVSCGVLLAASFLRPVYHPLQWLAIAAIISGLPPILLRAFAAARRLTLDVNILMLIAVGGSIALKDYREAGSIVFLFTIAEWLESRASNKATSVMSALMSMTPQKAILAETGEMVDASTVKANTIIAVKAGEVIPIDGVVVQGRSDVDESSLTGESFPVPKQPPSQVWAGTLNLNGYISVETTASAENSAAAKMTKLVEEAQNGKSGTQRIIDSCAKYYTPALVLTAALLATVPLAMKAHNVKHWIRLALVLLVSACPCALVLSTPVATFCALTRAAKRGLLIKGGDFLETLARTKVVAFDKTGTITRGEFTVMELKPTANVSLESLLYCIESKSSHPMASALVEFARLASIEPKPENVNEFHIYPGEGIYGEIDGKSFYIGNQRIAARAGCAAVPDHLGKEMKGATTGYVFSGAAPVGVFSLSDTCRTGAAEAIRELKRMGIRTAMLTGDSSAAAMFAQNQLRNALDMVQSELLPEDKVRIIRDFKAKEGATAMVGDGMNDAPALSAADVGISMGLSGSAIAMETSHITLMSNDIRKIPGAVRLGRTTRPKIVENIVLSVATKAAILALAFAGHPLLWAAVLSDVGTCLLVIFNGMLLLKTSDGKGGQRCKADGHGSKGAHHGWDACTSSEYCTNRINANGANACCSHGTGGCSAHEDAKESRAVLAAAHRQGGGCSISLAPCVCHGHSHGHDHADDHNHQNGHVQNRSDSGDNVRSHAFAESRTNLGDGASHDSHSIFITVEDENAGHNEDSCNTGTSNKCAAGRCGLLEEQKVVLNICAHRKDEEECLRYIACEKPYACTASYHAHRVCPDWGGRQATACCRSYCRGFHWTGGQRGDRSCMGVGGALPQSEIVTE